MSISPSLFRTNPQRRQQSAQKTWTTEDLRQLRELATQGVAPAMIAVRLRKTESAIRNKAGMHGISLRAAPRGRADYEVAAVAAEG